MSSIAISEALSNSCMALLFVISVSGLILEYVLLMWFNGRYYEFSFPAFRKRYAIPISGNEEIRRELLSLLESDYVAKRRGPCTEKTMVYYARLSGCWWERPVGLWYTMSSWDRIRLEYKESDQTLSVEICIMPMISPFFVWLLLLPGIIALHHLSDGPGRNVAVISSDIFNTVFGVFMYVFAIGSMYLLFFTNSHRFVRDFEARIGRCGIQPIEVKRRFLVKL